MKFCLVVFFATKLVFHCKVCSQKQLLVIAVTLIFKIAAKKLRSGRKELHWPPFLIVAIDLVFICFLKWEEFLKESARFIWIFIFNFKIRSHNFKEIKYLQSWQNETLPQYHESKLGFFKEINRALDSKEIFSSVWSWGTFQTLDILLQISWKLQTENCVSSCAQRKGNLAKIKNEKRLRASSIRLGIRLLQGFAKVKDLPQSRLVRLSLNVL